MNDSYPPDLVQQLTQMVQLGASDLHLCSGFPPGVRIDGRVVALYDRMIDGAQTRQLVLEVLTNAQRARLEENLELDFAVEVEGVGRFRGNAHFSRGELAASFRHIPHVVPKLEELGHRPSIFQFCAMRQGLVLVTGTTGSGKSTTLASIIMEISKLRRDIIITIEDPIEYYLSGGESYIKQREVGTDTLSFAEALKHVLRQDPDVIMVGEMRDPETMRAAITAAETGHLVLATVHTIDAPKAIDRIVDAFPAEQQAQIIAMLANCLQGIVSQHLIPRSDGAGRALATETLIATTPVRACIREHRWEQLPGIMEISAKDGMNTIDVSLGELAVQGFISPEEARARARDRQTIDEMLSAPQTKPKKGFFG